MAKPKPKDCDGNGEVDKPQQKPPIAEPLPLDDVLRQIRSIVPIPDGRMIVMGRTLSFFTEPEDLQRLIILSIQETQRYRTRLTEAAVLADVLREKVGVQ